MPAAAGRMRPLRTDHWPVLGLPGRAAFVTIRRNGTRPDVLRVSGNWGSSGSSAPRGGDVAELPIGRIPLGGAGRKAAIGSPPAGPPATWRCRAKSGDRFTTSRAAGHGGPDASRRPSAAEAGADRGRATTDRRKPQVPGDGARLRHQKLAIEMLILCLAVGKVPTVRNCIRPSLGGLTRLEAPLPETSAELVSPAFAACVPSARFFEGSDPPSRRPAGRAPHPDAPSAAGHAGAGREYSRQPRAAPSDGQVAGGGLARRQNGRRPHPVDGDGLRPERGWRQRPPLRARSWGPGRHVQQRARAGDRCPGGDVRPCLAWRPGSLPRIPWSTACTRPGHRPMNHAVHRPSPAEASDSAQRRAWYQVLGDADRPVSGRPVEPARTK